jgi:hypothetical protein
MMNVFVKMSGFMSDEKGHKLRGIWNSMVNIEILEFYLKKCKNGIFFEVDE